MGNQQIFVGIMMMNITRIVIVMVKYNAIMEEFLMKELEHPVLTLNFGYDNKDVVVKKIKLYLSR